MLKGVVGVLTLIQHRKELRTKEKFLTTRNSARYARSISSARASRSILALRARRNSSEIILYLCIFFCFACLSV